MSVENSASKHGIELPKHKCPEEPEHYCLSAAGLRATKRQAPTTLVASRTFQSKIAFLVFY